MNTKLHNFDEISFSQKLAEFIKNLPVTNREKEILKYIAQGKTNREISQELILSPSTVRNHITNIFTKLRISNRSQATAIAIYCGLLNINPTEQKNKYEPKSA